MGSHPSGILRLLPWVLAVFALAAAIVFGILWWGLHSQEATRSDVRATATEASLALTQFSYKNAHTDVAQIQKVATGDFKNQVKQLFSKNTISQIQKVKAVSDSQVESVFVQSVSGDSATAFAVVQETISNKLSRTPQTQTVRLQLDLIHASDGWKVDQVTLFQTPTPSGLGGPG